MDRCSIVSPEFAEGYSNVSERADVPPAAARFDT
jgi:hypothetical protein